MLARCRSLHSPLWQRLARGFGLLVIMLVYVLGWPLAGLSRAQESPAPERTPLPPPDPNEEPIGYMNLALGTMGGKQFWTDWFHRAGWRIQQNVITGHYRLLDPTDTRRAWGNYAHCLKELDARLPQDPDAQRLTDVVVLLHGLGRSRSSWDTLEVSLNRDGFRIVDFGYASTRATLDDHAKALDHVIRHLDNAQTVSFVGHSLGNLVVRRYLEMFPTQAGAAPERRRMVMLGPPNQGAEIARRLQSNPIFTLFTGDPGIQLSRGWEEIEPLLATPEFEFGILAGGGDATFSNPLVEGEDDLIVSTEETRLPGAIDFRTVASMHTFMPWDEEVMQLTRHFLAEGCFETREQRQPIR